MANNITPKWIRRIKRQGKRKRWTGYWEQPWTVPASALRARGYKRALRNDGRYSTNWTIAETKSKPDGCDCASTSSPYPRRTQKLIFKMERVRHAIGDKPIRNYSVYRNACHESCINGANGYHPRGQAFDPIRPSDVSVADWNRALYAEFGNGGVGTGCVSGEIQHVDNGPQRRWCYAGR